MSDPIKMAIDAAAVIKAPQPEPLLSPGEAPRPYPIDALPRALANAVNAYRDYGQQPISLVASSALASLSLCAQGLVNVGRDAQLTGPVSLNIIVVAASGERKTSCDRRLSLAPRQWQTSRRAAMSADVENAKSRVQAYEAEREGILGRIKSNAGKKSIADAADREDLKHQLIRLEVDAPRPPIIPSLFFEDVTPEKLAIELAEGWPSSSLWSDEAGLVIGGHGMNDESAMRFLALVNRLWDGTSFERKRATSKTLIVKGRRLTVSLMMQEVVLARLLAAGKGASRGLGFLARFLIAWPESTMGTRLYRATFDAASMEQYDARLRELLDSPLPADGNNLELAPPLLQLSPDAQREWINLHDRIERELGKRGEFSNVPDFAAKSAENAARIAALLHVFERGAEGEVSSMHVQAGAELAMWYLFESRRIISATEMPEAVGDAAALLEWLRQRGQAEVVPRDILRKAPSRLRDKKRRDAALRVLLETRHLFETTRGGATIFLLNLNLITEG